MSQMYRPNPYEPHRGGEPPDPNERLTQLRNELKQREESLTHLGKEKDDLSADIDGLQKTVTEVQTTLQDYGGQVKDLETRLHALQYFYEQKHKMVMAAIGDKKGPIDELIREFDYEIERMEERLAELREKMHAAKNESEAAGTALDSKQAEYDKVKGYKQKTLDNLADLDALRASITKADDATDIATMYCLVLEFQNRLSQTHILSQHQLAHELKQKLGELEAAKEHARAKSAASLALQTEYNAHKTTLQSKIDGRRQHLETTVQALYPVHAPQPAPAAADKK